MKKLRANKLLMEDTATVFGTTNNPTAKTTCSKKGARNQRMKNTPHLSSGYNNAQIPTSEKRTAILEKIERDAFYLFVNF